VSAIAVSPFIRQVGAGRPITSDGPPGPLLAQGHFSMSSAVEENACTGTSMRMATRLGHHTGIAQYYNNIAIYELCGSNLKVYYTEIVLTIAPYLTRVVNNKM
jgi:hypothetical protein